MDGLFNLHYPLHLGGLGCKAPGPIVDTTFQRTAATFFHKKQKESIISRTIVKKTYLGIYRESTDVSRDLEYKVQYRTIEREFGPLEEFVDEVVKKETKIPDLCDFLEPEVVIKTRRMKEVKELRHFYPMKESKIFRPPVGRVLDRRPTGSSP